MSIIDQARTEAERRLINPTGPQSGTRIAWFEYGAQWLLAHLTDPDPETVDAVAQGMFADFWRRDGMLPMPGESTTWDGSTDEIRDEWQEDARAAITALTNHLNGADHE